MFASLLKGLANQHRPQRDDDENDDEWIDYVMSAPDTEESFTRQWEAVFESTKILEICRSKHVYFSLIGTIETRRLALIVTKHGQSMLSANGWATMLNSFRKPREFKKDDLVVKFGGFCLDVSNVFYAVIMNKALVSHWDIIRDGIIQAEGICVSTYGSDTPARVFDCPGVELIDPYYWEARVNIEGRWLDFRVAESLVNVWLGDLPERRRIIYERELGH
ncbi:hypothetical protein B0T10DRAFT_567498 [Thelonectria olida]|uniref:Uncharacterized protein n=1 Tax=Thelonectria olida TaxID=1576542 RepID=A0A9P8VUZ3_9HYPO|nr:hypothetical protein B0T10DRAFT_567498 [Thelonectria olida]